RHTRSDRDWSSDVCSSDLASIDYLARIGGSSLTDANIAVSEADLGLREIPTSYVPFRNSHLLSIATSWAEVIGAQAVYIGAVARSEERRVGKECSGGVGRG